MKERFGAKGIPTVSNIREKERRFRGRAKKLLAKEPGGAFPRVEDIRRNPREKQKRGKI